MVSKHLDQQGKKIAHFSRVPAFAAGVERPLMHSGFTKKGDQDLKEKYWMTASGMGTRASSVRHLCQSPLLMKGYPGALRRGSTKKNES